MPVRLIQSLRHRAASLPARITAIAMLPALALAMLVGGLAISLRQDDLEAGLQQRGLLLTRQLASAADYGVFSGNRTALQALVESVSREQSVTAVRILDRDGKLLAQAGTPDSAPLPARLFAPAPLLFSEPIRSPSITIDDLDAAAAPLGKAADGTAGTADAAPAPGPAAMPGIAPGSDDAARKSDDRRAGAQPPQAARAGAPLAPAPGTVTASGAASPAPVAAPGPGTLSPAAAAGGASVNRAGEPGSGFAGRAEVMLSRDGIEEEKRRFALAVSGMLVLVLVVSGLVARRMSRRLSRPVVDAALAVERIGRGETGVRVQPSTIGVLDLLGRGVNDMAARLETSIQDLAARVQEATAQLLEKKEEAERANHAKSRFLAAASHDLRQPMHALGMFIAALEQQPATPMQRELLGQIDRAAAAMGDLLDSLLDISRLDAGVIEKRVAPLPLAAVFERVRSEFTGAARAKGLELVVRRTGQWVLSDRILLERILVNLVSNALRYTETGTVLVAARVCGAHREHLRIDVRDSGSGIAPAAQEAIFQEFVQLANPERDRSKGLGLGLSIVRRLVTLLDHRLILRSAPGRGSTFSVILPLATLASSHLASAPDPVASRIDDSLDSLQTTGIEPAPPSSSSATSPLSSFPSAPTSASASASASTSASTSTSASPSAPAPAGAPPVRTGDGKLGPASAAAIGAPKPGTATSETPAAAPVPLRAARFLVIDDDAMVRSGLVQLLSSWGGQVAEEAGDSELPARMVGLPLPDVILCDMRLANGLDGVALLQAIRQAVQRPVRAVVITGDTDPERVAMAGQGGDPVLHKPVRPAQLRALLRNLLHKPPTKP